MEMYMSVLLVTLHAGGGGRNRPENCRTKDRKASGFIAEVSVALIYRAISCLNYLMEDEPRRRSVKRVVESWLAVQ